MGPSLEIRAGSTPVQPQTTAPPTSSEPENPLARSFAEEEEEPKGNENLSFDFGNDPSDHHHLGEAGEAEDAADRWQVGEPGLAEPAEEPLPVPEINHARMRAASTHADPSSGIARYTGDDARTPARSSSFFVALFTLIVAGFAGLTFLIGISPPTSRAVLAQLPVLSDEFSIVPRAPSPVALREIHAEYRLLDGHRSALIVSGRAENRSGAPLHAIQVAVSLADSMQRQVATQAVFCGDLVSPKIISQMTTHELQFFQKLAPPKNFELKSGDSSPFLVMFVNPPSNVANFRVSVLKAEASPGDATASGV